jgi:hypothetical protein
MSTWTEWDGREFVTIASSKDHESLSRLIPKIAAKVWPNATSQEQSIHSCEDLNLSMNYVSSISVLKSKWDEIAESDQSSVISYAEGWTDSDDSRLAFASLAQW